LDKKGKTMNVKLTASLSLAVMAAFAATGDGASRAYVQRGLVAAYDGIDNVGTGSHDSSATTWKNLADDSSLDGVCDSKLSWNGSNGWTVTGDCKPVTVGSGLAAVISKTNCTIEVACQPSFVNKRFVYFSQYNGGSSYRTVSLENAVDGKFRLFRTRINSSAGDYNWAGITPAATANTFVSFSFALANKYPKFYKGGDLKATATAAWGDASASTQSVIGGEPWASSNRSGSNFDSTYKVAFNGTYHAFRVYNVTLTAAEIAWNAGLDAVRFDGADAATTLGEGYSYDAATDTLSVTASATATDGGTVAANGGAASSSVSASLTSGASATFVATPNRERGYVFDRWTGDTAAITTGTILTPAITVSANRPVSLVANFRRNGDAADGLKFDISFTGDKTADGLTFSSSNSETKHGYETADVPLPVYPIVTNANTTCLFFQQPDGTAAGSIFRQDVRRANTAVTGQVATVFVRFRWDEPTVTTAESFPTVVMNGYTGWNNNDGRTANGFAVRMRCGAGETRGYPILLVSRVAPGYQNAGITTTGTAYVNAGKWVDMFVSVYPSPTNPKLSNADIWYCEVPSWNADEYFNRSEIGHRHFGDRCGITNVVTTSAELRFGCEPNPNAAAITGADAGKAFRGAIACSKGWNRVLTENERWTVMRGLGGVQSFTDLETARGRTFTTCRLDVSGFEQARNGTATSFLGGGTEDLPRWRAMTTTYNSNTLLWDAPKVADPMPVVYSTKISNVKSGNTHPIHLEVNGTKVWPTDAASREVAIDDEIRVEIGAELTWPGLNELKWVYDTTTASNWMIFDHHKLKLITPPKAFVLIVR
jgi:hypothetical protein